MATNARKPIRVDSRVQERKKSKRVGTVVKCVGKNTWLVNFGGSEPEQVKTGSLSHAPCDAPATERADVQNEGGPSILQNFDTSASTLGHQFRSATTNTVAYLNGSSSSSEEDVDFIKTSAARRKLDFKPVDSDESSEQSSGSFQAAEYGRVIVSGEKVAAKKSGACAAAGRTSQKVAFRFDEDAGSPAIGRRASRDESDNEQQGRRNEERDVTTPNANVSSPTSSGDSTPPVNLSTPAPESPEDDTDEEVEPPDFNKHNEEKEVEDDIVEGPLVPEGAVTEDADEHTIHTERRDPVEVEKAAEYKTKFALYQREKQELIAKKHVMDMSPKKPPPRKVGVPVQEKQGAKRKGYIVENLGNRKWVIQFDNGDKDTLKSNEFATTMLIFNWTIVQDSTPDTRVKEHAHCGLVGFDFDKFAEPKLKAEMYDVYEFPFLQLLKYLWGGNWRCQLRLMNESIQDYNKTASKTKKARLVSEHEWWKFIGVLLSANVEKKGGERLWEKRDKTPDRRQSEHVDYGPQATGGRGIMPLYRFYQLKSHFPDAFHCADAKADGDPWYPVRAFVNGFNEVRRQKIAASSQKIHDESMSGFQPRTTKSGNLPMLSFVDRKPVPLGTEFKNTGCSVTGTILHLEIQEGSIPMKQKRWSNQFGSTTACTLRLVRGSQYSGRQSLEIKTARSKGLAELHIGDSWFASIKTAEQLKLEFGHEFIGVVKNNRAYFPRAMLEKQMELWPSGACLAYEVTSPLGVDLLAIGYKYNARTCLCFIATKNAGSLAEGDPYVARFRDQHGNAMTRKVPRPAIISKYFGRSNVIDTHNHLRQFLLRLEKYWVTHSGWFRIDTTLIGMTVTDCYLLLRRQSSNQRMKNQTLAQFVDNLTWELLNNPYKDEIESEYVPMEGDDADPMPAPVAATGFIAKNLSKLANFMTPRKTLRKDILETEENSAAASTVLLYVASQLLLHTLVKSADKSDGKENRTKRRLCEVKGCKKRTHMMCNAEVCRNSNRNLNVKDGENEYVGRFFCNDHFTSVHLVEVKNFLTTFK